MGARVTAVRRRPTSFAGVSRQDGVIHSNRLDRLLVHMVYARIRWYGYPIQLLLNVLGVDIPTSVSVGKNLQIIHGTSGGVVVHWNTTIGDGVSFGHRTTVGRAEAWKPLPAGKLVDIAIGDGVVLGTGAVVVGKPGVPLRVGAGTILAANSVLTRSTGEREVWGGIPAVKIGERDD